MQAAKAGKEFLEGQPLQEVGEMILPLNALQKVLCIPQLLANARLYGLLVLAQLSQQPLHHANATV